MKFSLSMTALVLAACSAGDDSGAGVGRAPAGGGGTLVDPTTPTNTTNMGGPSTPTTPTDEFATEEGDALEEANCGLESFAVEQRPTDVLLVLDRSGSMRELPEGGNDQRPKWDLTVPALNQVLMETNAGVSWGMKLFPEGQGNGSCSAATINDQIHVPIAPGNAVNVVAAIGATTPDGDGTPTGDAVQAAVKYLSGLTTGTRKYILLATDGEPSCSPSGEGQEEARPYAVAAVTQAVAAGFPVFVVGVATTKDTATQALNDMALAGGVSRPDPNPLASRYYLANTQDELLQAMRAITGQIASCVFPLSKPPPVPTNIGVKVGGVLVPQDTTRIEGWEYTSPALTEVEVYGSWCDQVQSAAATDVQVIFACEGDIIR
jgi:hypothetical protein